jgi:UDP-N-acetyl-D-galactosamine dehydrogenase
MMHSFHVRKIIKLLNMNRKCTSGARILILGVTFKPNVRDYRNSRIQQLIAELREFGFDVYAHDPYVNDQVIRNTFGATPVAIDQPCDAIVLAVNHEKFREEVEQIKKRQDVLFIDITF